MPEAGLFADLRGLCRSLGGLCPPPLRPWAGRRHAARGLLPPLPGPGLPVPDPLRPRLRLAAYKAETLADIRAAAAGLSAIVDREIGLHVAYCRSWGMTEAEMASAEEAEATMAYTRYVLESGCAGDLLDLQVALTPCIVGYAEIGRTLADDPASAGDGNPYQSWIETYAGADYQGVAAAHVAQMDALFARRGGAGRLPALTASFTRATRLERAFWEMGFAASATGPA